MSRATTAAPAAFAVPFAIAAIVLAVVVAACGGAAAPSPSPAPSATPGHSTVPDPAPASPAPTAGSAGIIVTLKVADKETYKIRLTDPAAIKVAYDLLAGKEGPGIPNGKVVRGSADVNEGYTWHIDWNDVQWADMTTEVCDGLPSFVEKGEVSGDRFCPWAAKVVAIAPAPPLP